MEYRQTVEYDEGTWTVGCTYRLEKSTLHIVELIGMKCRYRARLPQILGNSEIKISICGNTKILKKSRRPRILELSENVNRLR